jgi:hypothetical protein
MLMPLQRTIRKQDHLRTYVAKDLEFSKEWFDLDCRKYKNGLVRFQVACNKDKVIESSGIGRARGSVRSGWQTRRSKGAMAMASLKIHGAAPKINNNILLLIISYSLINF